MKYLRLAILFLSALAATSCGPTPESVGSTSSNLSSDQCSYFEVDGRVTICHVTNSPKKPVVKLKVALDVCAESHSLHPHDYVAVNDYCGPNACLAEGAPCDSTLRCCSGACTPAGLCS